MKLPLLWILLFGHVNAQEWRLEASTKAAPLGHDAIFVVKTVAGPVRTDLKLVVFDDKNCRLRVVTNADRKTARPLDEMGRNENALAVCNGGYFHAGGDFGPSGLEIAGGIRADVFRGDGGLVGALMVQHGKPSLVWEKEFRDSPNISEFLQCSPWLVSDGRVWTSPTPDEPPQRNNRTFIMTDTEGRWAIGVCKGVGLLELAQILVSPGVVTEMKVTRALNLDGGPSTGLWCRSKDGRVHFEKPGWAVRNAIVVVPRDSN